MQPDGLSASSGDGTILRVFCAVMADELLSYKLMLRLTGQVLGEVDLG